MDRTYIKKTIEQTWSRVSRHALFGGSDYPVWADTKNLLTGKGEYCWKAEWQPINWMIKIKQFLWAFIANISRWDGGYVLLGVRHAKLSY